MSTSCDGWAYTIPGERGIVVFLEVSSTRVFPCFRGNPPKGTLSQRPPSKTGRPWSEYQGVTGGVQDEARIKSASSAVVAHFFTGINSPEKPNWASKRTYLRRVLKALPAHKDKPITKPKYLGNFEEVLVTRT